MRRERQTDRSSEFEHGPVDGVPALPLQITVCRRLCGQGHPVRSRAAYGIHPLFRTYVALLTGDHQFNVSEKFIAQIEPLHNVSQVGTSDGRRLLPAGLLQRSPHGLLHMQLEDPPGVE